MSGAESLIGSNRPGLEFCRCSWCGSLGHMCLLGSSVSCFARLTPGSPHEAGVVGSVLYATFVALFHTLISRLFILMMHGCCAVW
jgi:hypothetical protein